MQWGIKNIYVFISLNIMQKKILESKHDQDIPNSHKLKHNTLKGSTPWLTQKQHMSHWRGKTLRIFTNSLNLLGSFGNMHALVNFPTLTHFLSSWVEFKKSISVPLLGPNFEPPIPWRLGPRGEIDTNHTL